MAKKKTATAEAVFGTLMGGYATLPQEEKQKLRDLIYESAELSNSKAAFKILKAGFKIRALQMQRSKRSRPEDKERNDKIVAEREAGKTLGEIARTHKVSIETVKGVINRRKAKSAK